MRTLEGISTIVRGSVATSHSLIPGRLFWCHSVSSYSGASSAVSLRGGIRSPLAEMKRNRTEYLQQKEQPNCHEVSPSVSPRPLELQPRTKRMSGSRKITRATRRLQLPCNSTPSPPSPLPSLTLLGVILSYLSFMLYSCVFFPLRTAKREIKKKEKNGRQGKTKKRKNED